MNVGFNLFKAISDFVNGFIDVRVSFLFGQKFQGKLQVRRQSLKFGPQFGELFCFGRG